MPLTIPPFSQFQAPLYPLRGLWNKPPAEGDRFVAAEIDWGTYPPGQGIQFALSGNSPVALSQIVALSVDNARCGSDVQFVFADSGFILQVPSHCQGVYPCFTNGLMFYAIALNASAQDVTCFNVHNSMPPPIPVQQSDAQNHAVSAGIPLQTNGSTQVIPATISGTLNSGTLTLSMATGVPAGVININLIDGRGSTVWSTGFSQPADTTNEIIVPLSGLNVRFFNGLSVVIGNSTFTGNFLVANLYYSVP